MILVLTTTFQEDMDAKYTVMTQGKSTQLNLIIYGRTSDNSQ